MTLQDFEVSQVLDGNVHLSWTPVDYSSYGADFWFYDIIRDGQYLIGGLGPEESSYIDENVNLEVNRIYEIRARLYFSDNNKPLWSNRPLVRRGPWMWPWGDFVVSRGTSNTTMSRPSNVQIGDLEVIGWMGRNSDEGPPGPLAGWTLHGTISGGSGTYRIHAALYSRLATTTGSQSFTFDMALIGRKYWFALRAEDDSPLEVKDVAFGLGQVNDQLVPQQNAAILSFAARGGLALYGGVPVWDKYSVKHPVTDDALASTTYGSAAFSRSVVHTRPSVITPPDNVDYTAVASALIAPQ